MYRSSIVRGVIHDSYLLRGTSAIALVLPDRLRCVPRRFRNLPSGNHASRYNLKLLARVTEEEVYGRLP